MEVFSVVDSDVVIWSAASMQKETERSPQHSAAAKSSLYKLTLMQQYTVCNRINQIRANQTSGSSGKNISFYTMLHQLKCPGAKIFPLILPLPIPFVFILLPPRGGAGGNILWSLFYKRNFSKFLLLYESDVTLCRNLMMHFIGYCRSLSESGSILNYFSIFVFMFVPT